MEVQWPSVFNIALGINFGLLGSAILVGTGFVLVMLFVRLRDGGAQRSRNEC